MGIALYYSVNFGFQNVRRDTKVLAANGESFLAVDLFSMALHYLSQRVLTELADQGCEVTPHKVRWVVTVPAIWSHSAKQFIREAAYKVKESLNDLPFPLAQLFNYTYGGCKRTNLGQL